MTVIASGDLADRPVGRTLATIAQRRFTGELRVDSRGLHVTMGWREGLVVTAAGSHPADGAVKTALGLGLITSTQASDLLRTLLPGDDDVATVVDRARLGPEQASRLARRVVAHRAMRLLALDQGGFELDDTLRLAVPPGRVPIDPRIVVYLGARAHMDAARVTADLEQLGSSFAIPPGVAAPADELGFSDDERQVVAALALAHTPDGLVQALPQLDPRNVLAVLYVLATFGVCAASGVQRVRRPTTRAEAPGAPAAPPGDRPASATIVDAAVPAHAGRGSPTGRHVPAAAGAGAASDAVPAAPPRGGTASMPAVSAPRVTTPPPRTSATYRAVTLPLRVQPSAVAPSDTSDLRDLVTQHAQLVDAGADHFALLGVTREEPPDRVRAAYFALARRLHPDRISAARLDDLRPVAQRVFAQVNAAFSTLSDPGRRAAYVSTLAAGGAAAVARAQDAADERTSRIVLAEEQFRAGEAALRRNQLEAAVAAFKQAVELNPAECEHHALLAWTTFCLASDKPAAAKAARGALRRASEMSDKNPLPHLYLGKVARTVGDDEAAARHFRDCLTAMPGHVDATTELRVIEARLGTGGGKPRETGSKGLLGLLKR